MLFTIICYLLLYIYICLIKNKQTDRHKLYVSVFLLITKKNCIYQSDYNAKLFVKAK